ncbi:MAG: hypothetical protein J0M34_01555 [Alphaproteobacteria bacterium]|nr:hypothetical protein [Alphaproteobacteria bacterium]
MSGGSGGGLGGLLGGAGGLLGGSSSGGGGSGGGSEPPGAAGPTANHLCQNVKTCDGAVTGSSYDGDGCDVRYRNVDLKYEAGACEKKIAEDGGRCSGASCDEMNLRSIEGRPAFEDEPLPHITTPRASFMTNYSPFLFYNHGLKNLDDNQKLILGDLYRGANNSTYTNYSLIKPQTDTPPARGVDASNQRFAACVDQIRVPQEPDEGTSPEEWARIMRLKVDNCANQFILNGALIVNYKQDQGRLAYTGENPNNRAEKHSIHSLCQPLKIKTSFEDNDYHASEYILGAWKKLLYDPNFRINSRARGEPRLPQGVTLENAVAPPAQIPDVRLSMLANTPYEEIIDPSHPFSPRWDYETNDRAKFAASPSPVFCAGDKEDKIIPVDILRFRDEATNFTENMQKRIDFNKNCLANSGLQKDPCCVPVILPPPAVSLCIPMPCSICYAALTAEMPACGTNYKTTLDRHPLIPPMIPLNPARAAMQMIQNLQSSMQNLDLNNLPDSLQDLDPEQLKGVIDANRDLISTFAPDFPIDQMTGLLEAGANLSSRLPNLMQGGMNLDLNAAFMNAQGSIMEAMKDFNPEQIGQFMQGQIGMLQNFTAGDLNRYASALNIPTGLLSQLPSDLTVAGAGNMLREGANMMGSFNPSAAGQNISSALANARSSIANFPDSQLFNSISGSASMNIPGIGNISGSTTVGEVRQFLAAQSAASPDATVGAITSQLGRAQDSLAGLADSTLVNNLSIGARANIPGIGSIGGNTTVGELRQLLSAQQNGLGQINPQELMRDIGPAVQQQFVNIAQNIPGVAQAAEAARFLQSQAANLGQISQQFGNINMQTLSANLSTQWGSISASVRNFNPQQIGTMMQGFGNSIQGMAGRGMASIQQAMQGNYQNLMSAAGSIGGAAATAGQVAAALGIQSEALNQAIQIGGTVQSAANAISTVNSAMNAASGAASAAGTMTLPEAMMWLWPPRAIAACDPMEPRINTSTVASMCEKLRAPVTPLNKLKLRYYDPAHQEESELPSGVPEGLTFAEYFGGNMPYMRLHDTGRPIQTSTDTKQDPMDDKGQYAAIVGVGREAIAGDAEFKDQRCLLGGWGEPASFGGTGISRLPDPVTSWTELKLYQMRSIRDKQVYCIGRHEKLFKPTGTEEILLYLAGGQNDTFVGATASPLTWRGYIYDLEESRRFPNFPDQEPERIAGLDEAQVKDIVILPVNGGEDDDGLRGLPRLGIVEEVNTNDDNWYIKVKMADDGDAPDTCGTTDASGNPPVSRYFYKPGHHDALDESLYEEIGSDMDCADQNLKRCVMADWDDIELYRARDHLRISSGS